MTSASIISDTTKANIKENTLTANKQDASKAVDAMSTTREKRKAKKAHIHNARKLIRQQHSGVLSTMSLSITGFPFGSIIPFLMTENGDLVIYASDIAQHSRNMKADPKVSVCVHDATEQDSQANARVTVCAYAEADAVGEDLQKAYFTVFPQAKAYLKAHDFRFYLLHVDRVRYIGGFGEIYWFSQDEWSESKKVLAQSKAAIEHMHTDHADALLDIVKAHRFATNTVTPIGANEREGRVSMLTCYAEGFHFATSDNEAIQFVPFLAKISDGYDLRKAMVDLTKISRTQDAVSTP